MPYTGSGDYDFYTILEDGIYGLKAETGEKKLLLELDREVTEYAMPLSDGQYLILRRNYFDTLNTFYLAGEAEVS